MDGRWPELLQVNPDLTKCVQVCVCVRDYGPSVWAFESLCLFALFTLTHILNGQHWEHPGPGECVSLSVCVFMSVCICRGES